MFQEVSLQQRQVFLSIGERWKLDFNHG